MDSLYIYIYIDYICLFRNPKKKLKLLIWNLLFQYSSTRYPSYIIASHVQRNSDSKAHACMYYYQVVRMIRVLAIGGIWIDTSFVALPLSRTPYCRHRDPISHSVTYCSHCSNQPLLYPGNFNRQKSFQICRSLV